MRNKQWPRLLFSCYMPTRITIVRVHVITEDHGLVTENRPVAEMLVVKREVFSFVWVWMSTSVVIGFIQYLRKQQQNYIRTTFFNCTFLNIDVLYCKIMFASSTTLECVRWSVSMYDLWYLNVWLLIITAYVQGQGKCHSISL